MREISTTVTCGSGSEKHNHDLEYRETLEHVHARSEGVVELIPYRSYEEQINEMLKPYIDEYNEKQQARYQSAWERYNQGEIKTKPRKRNYQPISYDYYNEHKDDTYYNRNTNKQEALPMFRSMIIGLGDQSDRQNGTITEEEAKRVFAKVIEKWEEDFPYFHLLSATIHLDEAGFFHCHVDYKSLYEHDIGQGLSCGIGHEKALELMGFKPEQSIINGRDKVPLLFNAFRNKIYSRVEEALADEGIRLQYGVSKTKDPTKDTSKNQKLETWQEQQDTVREIQHQKNVALDIIEADEISPEGLKELMKTATGIENTLKEVESAPRSRMNKDNVVVKFTLFSQLQSLLKNFKETVAYAFQQIEFYKEKFSQALHELGRAEDYIAEVEPRLNDLQQKYNNSIRERAELENAARHYKRESEKKDKFMSNFNLDGHSLKEEYDKQQKKAQEREISGR